MDNEELLALATPYLAKNDFGVGHTKRVYEAAKKHFVVKPELEELTFASIILHDIGGSTIREQYKKGPTIATLLLKKMNFADNFIESLQHNKHSP